MVNGVVMPMTKEEVDTRNAEIALEEARQVEAKAAKRIQDIYDEIARLDNLSAPILIRIREEELLKIEVSPEDIAYREGKLKKINDLKVVEREKLKALEV